MIVGFKFKINNEQLIMNSKNKIGQRVNEDKKSVFLSENFIPDQIKIELGEIIGISDIKIGRDSSVYKIESEKGKFILKIGQNERVSNEYSILGELVKKKIGADIPKIYSFFQDEKSGFLLEEYIEGDSLGDVFSGREEVEVKRKRLMIEEVAKTLKKIHLVDQERSVSNFSLKKLLLLAENNFEENLIDKDEFKDIDTPKDILSWLKKNVPEKMNLSLLHGDFRPKNIRWLKNKIIGVVDWEHSFIGDPYYDLAVFDYYLKDKSEKELFRKSYGLENNFDENKLKYFDFLSKFLNV